jgi:septal ring factor EnvC (AmiA/AmiB activator)
LSKKFNIGPKIVLDGESDYKKAISGINSSMKVLTSEMKKASAEFSENSKGLKALKAETQLYSEKVALQEEKVRTLQGALEHAKKEYGENSEEVKRWAVSLNDAEADLKKMTDRLDELKKQTTGIGKIKTVFNDMKSSLNGVKEKISPIIDGFKKLGTVAVNSLKSVVSIGAKTIASIGAMGGALTTAFLSTAESTREFRSEMGKLETSFTTNGKSVEAAKSTYNELYSVIGETDQCVEAAQQISLLSQSEQDAAKWAGYAAGIYSRFGDALQPETFYESANETLKLGQATGAYAQMLEGCGVSVDDFNAKLAACKTVGEKQALMLKTTESLLGAASAAYKATNADIINANKVQAQLTESMARIGAVSEPIVTSFKGIGASFLNSIVPSIELFGQGLRGVLEGTTGAGEKLTSGLRGVAKQATTFIRDELPKFAEIAASLISAFTESLLSEESVSMVMSTTISLLKSMVDTFIKNIDLLIGACVTIISSISLALTENDNLKKITDAALTIIMKLSESMIELVPQLIDCGFQLIAGLVKGLWDNRDKVWTTIKNLGKTLISTFTSLLGIHSPSTIFAGFGKNLVQGLINGIENVKGWLREKIRSLGSTIISTAKDILGIHSPSTEFEALGDFSGQGYGIGFINSMKRVKEQMKQAVPTSLDSDVGVKVKASIQTVNNELSGTYPARSNGSAFSLERIKLYVSLHIDKFINSAEQDIDELVDTISEKLYTKIKREMEAFA